MSPIRDDDKLPDSAEKVANEEGKKSGRCDSCRLRKKRCDGSHEDCAKNTQPGSGRNGRVQAFEYACPQREAPPTTAAMAVEMMVLPRPLLWYLPDCTCSGLAHSQHTSTQTMLMMM